MATGASTRTDNNHFEARVIIQKTKDRRMPPRKYVCHVLKQLCCCRCKSLTRCTETAVPEGKARGSITLSSPKHRPREDEKDPYGAAKLTGHDRLPCIVLMIRPRISSTTEPAEDLLRVEFSHRPPQSDRGYTGGEGCYQYLGAELFAPRAPGSVKATGTFLLASFCPSSVADPEFPSGKKTSVMSDE